MARTKGKVEKKTEVEQHIKDEGRTKNDPRPQPSKKRKKATESDEPQKAPRRSGRGTQNAQPSQLQLLKYMLTQDCLESCSPEDELEYIKNHKNARTYTASALNPFEELLCAIILSRPISHRLGLRSIRTVLNDPYNFNSAKATKSAGGEKQHQALWDAKTQHKQKTAEEIGLVADTVMEKFTSSKDKDGVQLQKLLDENGGDVDKALDTIKSNVKGVGRTGMNIFLRRVQWIWEGGYPFVDDRTMQALKTLGLPQEAEELQKLLEQNWSTLETKNLDGKTEAAKKRRAFVVVLERAIGADLEGKIDRLLQAAA